MSIRWMAEQSEQHLNTKQKHPDIALAAMDRRILVASLRKNFQRKLYTANRVTGDTSLVLYTKAIRTS